MIAKISKHSSFEIVLKHVLENVQANIFHSNMVSKNIKDLAREFRLFTCFQPHLLYKCYHIILSIISREEGHILGECNQHIGEYEYNRLVRRYLQELGFLNNQMYDKDAMDKCQYIAAIKHRQGREEIHIIVSGIKMDGNAIDCKVAIKFNEIAIKIIKEEFSLIDDFEEGLELAF
jgi:hypothetical protein